MKFKSYQLFLLVLCGLSLVVELSRAAEVAEKSQNAVMLSSFLEKNDFLVGRNRSYFGIKKYGQTMVVFYLANVSSNNICHAVAESYLVDGQGVVSNKKFISKDYVSVVETSIDMVGCAKLSIDNYFTIGQRFSDATLVAIYKYFRDTILVKQKDSRIYSLSVEDIGARPGSKILFEMHFGESQTEEKGELIQFDLIDGKIALYNRQGFIYDDDNSAGILQSHGKSHLAK